MLKVISLFMSRQYLQYLESVTWLSPSITLCLTRFRRYNNSIMRIFITGGSGFVGKRLINSLSGRGHDGYVLEHKRKPALCSGLVSVPGSLSDVHTYSDYLRDVDVVVHLAATVDDWSLKDNYYKVILDGTKLLFEQSLNLGIKHFIFVSSLSVVNDTTDNIINEQSPYIPKPFCYYANSKIEAEKN